MNLGNKYGEKQKERKNLKHLIAYMKLGLSPESKFNANFSFFILLKYLRILEVIFFNVLLSVSILSIANVCNLWNHAF